MTTILENKNIQSMIAKISLKDYHKLGELGFLSEKMELIEGVIFNKMPKSPKHTFLVNSIAKILISIFNEKDFYVQIEQPISIQDSEPEPDISVIEGNQKDYSNNHPTSARLVVEISLTTYELDFRKQFVYAKANIPEYWLFNLNNFEVEVYKNPNSEKYLNKKIYLSSDFLEIEGTKINLKEFLG